MARQHRSTRFLTGLVLFWGITGSVIVSELKSGPPSSTASSQPRQWIIVRGREPPVRKSIQSWTRRNQHNVVIQSEDYSCGAAALATLLQFYFEDSISEARILQVILGSMDAEQVTDRQTNGLSMSDLLDAADELGYLGAVIRLPPEKIPTLPAPVIVRIEREEFKHFVVLRGSVGDRIHLADPIRGNVTQPAWRFMQEWSGEALVLGKIGFGLPEQHPLSLTGSPREPIESVPVRRWLIRALPPQAR